ncbi:MAG TPA: hypothetical protein VE988_17255, partial [Gemmataceae bacterium]|nr:hypothetical protein [Gemmataceae bacterium]
MDYCFVLVLVLLLLTVITLVGHFLWVMTAAVFGALFKFDDAATSPKPLASADRGSVRGGERSDIECILCGQLFVRRHRTCPQCGLDCKQEEAVELRDLDTTARQLGRLARLDETQREVMESTLGTVDRRRHELVKRLEQMTGFAKELKPQPSQPAVLEPTPPPKTAPAEQPINDLAEINTILSSNPDVRQWSPEQRSRALALYRAQMPNVWARLGPAQLLPLARLLRLAGLSSRALDLYGLLLLHHPQSWQACEAVVEAATLAHQLGQPEARAALIQKAASLPLTEAQRQLLEQLQTPAVAAPIEQDEIPTVLPIQRSTPAAPASAALVKPQIEELPTVPRAPRRSIGEMLAAFMEERNILWGELVGGLLIVGCSIALVISLREKLEEIQYFPFLVVGSVAAALLGAGRYTLSHWKLEATSRGLLVIGTLLVPLSFMVLAGVASGREGGLLEAAMEIGAIAFFTWLVRGATGVLLRQPIGPAAPRPDWLTTLAIMGASASQLLVPHIKENDFAREWLGLVGYVPAALLILTQGMTWQSVYRR